MADKRISQLTDRGTVANSDVVPIVVSGAVTTNKATISSIQTFMQGNLDMGVTSVGITLGSSGTDVSISGSPITSSGNITINIPTASATNRGLLSAADWTTFNNKANAGNYVTLDTTQTITAQKTFTTSGSSDTMIISHGSGSGFALDVIKAGSGEAIRVQKTSGSGNAMTISGGNFEAGTIVKTGGTSSQFLKADGSVDSSTYLTTGTAASTYVPYTGAAANVDLGVYNLTSSAVNVNGSGSNAGVINLESNTIFPLVNGYGTIGSGTTNQFNFYQTTGAGVFRGAILSLNSIPDSVTRTYTLPNADGTLALSSDLGAYLPLAGGTLTGALNGTSAAFTGAVSGSAVTITATTGIAGDFTNNSTTNETLRARNNGSGNIAAFRNASAEVASITNSGGLTLSGALNGTSASFSSTITSTITNGLVLSNNTSTTQYVYTSLANSVGNARYGVDNSSGGGLGTGTSANSAVFGNAGNADVDITTNNISRLKIASTGAATFSSSVTATQFITGGTPSNTAGFTNSFYAESNIPSLTLSNTGTNTGKYTLGVTNGNFGIWNNPTSSYRLFIDSTGNVGIGTASPPRTLSIESTDVWMSYKVTGNREYLIGMGTSDALRIYDRTAETERMRINSGGYLKASNDGTYSSASGTFHEFRTSLGNNNVVYLINTASSNPYGPYINFLNAAPNDSTRYFLLCSDTGADRFIARSNGGIANYQANDVNLSDERTKKDIEPLESYWDKFKAIEIVKFKYKDQTHDDFNIGVIAQQVEAVAPEFVDVDGWNTKPEVDEEGNEIVSEEEPLKSIYTADLHHATIRVLQEAMAKIEKLETEIDSLKNQIK